ncbi:hypothetical protein ACQ4PT_050656 [Festuca glaucescens]
MALFAFFAASVLAATAVLVAGQEGFLSIDCGLDAQFSGRRDTYTNILYVSDSPYVDGGENRKIAADQMSYTGNDPSLQTLRNFPSGVRNCYTIPTESGAKYLVRMEFMYGNYDGQNSSSVQFDIHLGTNFWDAVTLSSPTDDWWSEAIFVAWSSWVPVCLVNTGGGTPFVSTVELRPLQASLYPDVSINVSMSTYARKNLGTSSFTRFPDDPYDRFWGWRNNSLWTNISTQETIQLGDNFAVPNPILQTAIAPISNGTVIIVREWESFKASFEFMVFLHFADFQKRRLQQFTVYINNEVLDQYSPKYLTASSVQNSGWYRATDGKYSVTLAATNLSVLPPMINAYEIYNLIPDDMPRTSSEDFEAMMAIKREYGVNKNWNGDPCFPAKYAWNGVKCSNVTGNTTRIIYLDMSNSSLNGSISNNFKLLTQLKFLDLSGNSLNGPIPYTLCQKNARPLIFRYESGEDMCNKTISAHPARNKIATIISIVVVVPMVVVVVLVLSCLIWRRNRKNQISTYDPPSAPTPNSAPVSTKRGFGLVYYGRLEDDTKVAIKMRSESSSHGLDEFLAEVNSLTKVHHRNLVSLVGYCWEKDHLALVYEYMSRGSLCDQLRGKNDVGEIKLELEDTCLDYLHKGCSLPIIHRDVKSNNILLDENLQAKIADFGLCTSYFSDTQDHISTIAAGSAGYMDPEYYHTGWLAESSDVYSFGVVILEVATGEPPILPGHGHIVQRVKQKISSGNVSMVADAKMGGAYDVNSMWKLVDTAMACTRDVAIQRPTMSVVVAQLKESLAFKESRGDNSVPGSFTSTTGAPNVHI